MTLLDKIINAGYSEELPNYLRKRVQPTNIVALIMLVFIGIPFLLLTPIYFPTVLTLCPIIGSLLCMGVIVGNYLGGIRWTRILLGFVGVTTGWCYNMLLSGPQEPPIPGVFLITLSFSLISFVTLDRKEYVLLVISLLYSCLVLLGFPFTRSWFTLEGADATVLRTGWLSYVITFLGIVTSVGCMIGLTQISRKSETEAQEALDAAQEQNNRLTEERADNERKTKALEEAQENERKQQWISNGISKISEIIRVQSNDEAIFDTILQNLVKYLQVTQGGLFVVDLNENNPEDTRIHLAACYAYERKKYVSREVHPGEGMLGQAYLEKMPSYYHEVPEGYVNITSGLGQAQPRCLLIVPLMVNEVVEGLIELASFQALEDYQQTFVEQVGEVIAAYIQSNRNVRRMQDLLSKAQEQAEELSAQEEEIRQNMEEMQATHEHHERTMEEMQRERDELLEKIAGLEGQEAQSEV